jgi:hypothetical protein
MPVQGAESPHPESTARAICEFCDARSNASLTDAELPIESSEEFRFVTANRATDADIISIHVRSMQPPACSRKFRILLAVESENVACKSVGAFFDGFVNPRRRCQQKSKSIHE